MRVCELRGVVGKGGPLWRVQTPNQYQVQGVNSGVDVPDEVVQPMDSTSQVQIPAT